MAHDDGMMAHAFMGAAAGRRVESRPVESQQGSAWLAAAPSAHNFLREAHPAGATKTSLQADRIDIDNRHWPIIMHGCEEQFSCTSQAIL